MQDGSRITDLEPQQTVNSNFLSCGVYSGGGGSPHELLVGMKTSATTLESSLAASQKLNVEIHTTQEIPLLGIYPGEMKTHVHTKAFTRMLIAALVLIAPNWKQHCCPSAGEWRNDGIHPYNRIVSHSTKGRSTDDVDEPQ